MRSESSRTSGVFARRPDSRLSSPMRRKLLIGVGSATLANTPYNDITALNLKDSWLRLNFGNAAGAPTAGDFANSHFSTTAPISMASSQIFLDNASFSSTSTNFFDYSVVQGFGTATITGGNNRIGFRSADTGGVTLTFADILKPNAGTTLELHIDSLSGAALGTSQRRPGRGGGLAAEPGCSAHTLAVSRLAVPAPSQQECNPDALAHELFEIVQAVHLE